MAEGGGGVLRELLAIFEVKADTSGLKKGESELSEFVDKVKKFGEALIAAFAVEQIYEFTEAQVKAMSAISSTAAQLGVSTDAVQGFQFAAKSLGLDADALTNSMGRLQVAQNAAAEGSGEQAEVFAKLGVNIRDTNGTLKSGDALFNDVATGISKISDPAKQAGAAVALFGRSGRSLLPILKKGGDGVARLLEEYKELGGGYGQDAIAQSEKFEEQSAKVDLVLTNLKGTIAQQLMPVFLQAGKWLMQALKWIKGLTEETTIFRAILIGFVGVVGALTASLIVANLPLILMAAAFIALILIVDDLIELFTGGDSQIGAWIDEAFGKGQSTDMVASIKNLWNDVTEIVKSMIPYLKDAWELTSKIWKLAKKPGEAIGDVAGQIGNAVKMSEDHSATDAERNRQGTIKQSAQAYLAAQRASGGQPVNEAAGLSVMKGQTKEQAIKDRDAYIDRLSKGAINEPGAYGPTLPAGQSSAVDSKMETKIEVNVTATPGTDGAAVGTDIAKALKPAQDDANREHMARLQRSGI